MKIIGQVDTSQYVPKRKGFRQAHYLAESSLDWGKPEFLQNNSIQNNIKPLQGSVQTHISFKGFDFNTLKKALKPVIKPVPKKLTEKVFDSLKNISDSQYEYYQKIRKNYVDFIKIDLTETTDAKEILRRKASAAFRKKHGISDEIVKNISEENLYYLPKNTLLVNFAQQVAAPFKAVYRGISKLVLPKNSQKAEIAAIEEKVLKDFSGLQGLLKSHEIWEKRYRLMSGNPKWNQVSDFLIPDDVLYSKIQRRRNKVVDPNKGKYSSTSMMLGNRFISGIIYSYFLGTDAYNTTMRYSNDKHEAASQRKSRVAQEFSRIGLNMYIQNLLFGTFETAVNRSLPTAMFVSGSTVAFSEVLGRKLVGKPIMPSDKATLDRLENEMTQKKGILPAIGRLLTNVKKKDEPKKAAITDNAPSVTYQKTKPSEKTFRSFSAKEKNETASADTPLKNNAPSFKGYYKVENLFDKKKLSYVMKLVEEADSKTAQSLKDSVMKSVSKSQIFEKLNLKKPETFEELMNLQDLKEVPIGTKKTVWGLWTSSILVPVKFVKNLILKSANGVQKLFNIAIGKKNDEISKQLEKLAKSAKDADKAKYLKFKEFYEKRLQLEAWAKSSLSETEKELRIFKEFQEIAGKDREDIEGVKNILLWLDNQIRKENIKINADGTLETSAVQRVKELLLESVLRADSAKHVEYDGNTLAQTNINLSRAITTLFLMTDAYNLTMQYSNDNRKDANKSAKNRAAQEVSRIAVSAYILAFVHNLLSKLCNSSLAGAFTLTAITSSINDSISRKVVGVPLTAKDQKQLQEIDKENAKSKSPIKKALAYSIGKKSALPQSNVNLEASDMNYFENDFFIKPEIS